MQIEEQVGLFNMKGKRTKRMRHYFCSSSLSASSSSGDFDSISTTNFEIIDQEEKDMANCLILLAQGRSEEGSNNGNGNGEKGSSVNSKLDGFVIYECKTCNRTFPSFQALGGHRASHKRPKPITVEENGNKIPLQQTLTEAVIPKPITALQLSHRSVSFVSNNKAKIHECSICGSEFASGQALGGHMRRHRAAAVAPVADAVRPRDVLQLDLNLPAPEDDLRDSKFQFPATGKPLVLSAAPALVDCHY